MHGATMKIANYNLFFFLERASRSALIKYKINSLIYVSTTNIYWIINILLLTYISEFITYYFPYTSKSQKDMSVSTWHGTSSSGWHIYSPQYGGCIVMLNSHGQPRAGGNQPRGWAGGTHLFIVNRKYV